MTFWVNILASLTNFLLHCIPNSTKIEIVVGRPNFSSEPFVTLGEPKLLVILFCTFVSVEARAIVSPLCTLSLSQAIKFCMLKPSVQNLAQKGRMHISYSLHGGNLNIHEHDSIVGEFSLIPRILFIINLVLVLFFGNNLSLWWLETWWKLLSQHRSWTWLLGVWVVGQRSWVEPRTNQAGLVLFNFRPISSRKSVGFPDLVLMSAIFLSCSKLENTWA